MKPLSCCLLNISYVPGSVKKPCTGGNQWALWPFFKHSQYQSGAGLQGEGIDSGYGPSDKMVLVTVFTFRLMTKFKIQFFGCRNHIIRAEGPCMACSHHMEQHSYRTFPLSPQWARFKSQIFLLEAYDFAPKVNLSEPLSCIYESPCSLHCITPPFVWIQQLGQDRKL